MARLLFTTNLSRVAAGVRVRSDRAYLLANAASERIAEHINTIDIPALYPGEVAKTIAAVAEPYRSGGRLNAVRLQTNSPLYRWYEYGVGRHWIFATDKPLSFEWAKRGGARVFFEAVNHPGYTGRNRRGELRNRVADVARREWTEALRVGLRGS